MDSKARECMQRIPEYGRNQLEDNAKWIVADPSSNLWTEVAH